jgi:hypothetical protein
MRSQSNGHGSSYANGPGGPPLTITGAQLGRPQDDRFGG